MGHTLANAKRLVIKIGSSLLFDEKNNMLNHTWLSHLVREVATLWKEQKEIIIVSSGSIPLGRRLLQFKHAILGLEEKQAAAAVGQIQLAHAYQEQLAAHEITSAQILLTLDDSEDRKRYLNARNTLRTLLSLRAVPVINENDTVATHEVRYGDNDRLAARVAQMISADTLVLLSDIEGLYTANPRTNIHATFIPEVRAITPELIAMAEGSGTAYGSGGMVTKLAAAKIALASGCRMVIANGKSLSPLKEIDHLQKNTWFVPDITPLKSRKNWIAQHLKPKGHLVIDQGAVTALHQGKSLLSVGILEMKGDFNKGDAICILNKAHQEIARGLINYAAHEAIKIIGRQSVEHESILGHPGREEMVHRDDLVLTGLGGP